MDRVRGVSILLWGNFHCSVEFVEDESDSNFETRICLWWLDCFQVSLDWDWLNIVKRASKDLKSSKILSVFRLLSHLWQHNDSLVNIQLILLDIKNDILEGGFLKINLATPIQLTCTRPIPILMQFYPLSSIFGVRSVIPEPFLSSIQEIPYPDSRLIKKRSPERKESIPIDQRKNNSYRES